MFCVQCEQTIRTPAGNGCSYAQGMCGKTAETSDLQDLLIAALQGLSAWAVKAVGRQSFLHGSETLRVHRQINNGAACGEFGDFALRGEK